MAEFDDYGEDEPPWGCECCETCQGKRACCGMPEYCCVGYCAHRGEPGHFSEPGPNPDHPTMSYPERCLR